MPRQIECKHLCEMSVEEFWALRLDVGFDKHIAEEGKQNCDWSLNEEFKDAEGNRQIRRTAKTTYKENPVPKSVRNMVGDGEFAFTVRSTFWPELFDEARLAAPRARLPHHRRLRANGRLPGVRRTPWHSKQSSPFWPTAFRWRGCSGRSA